MKIKFTQIATSADSIVVNLSSDKSETYKKSQFNELLSNGISFDEFEVDTLKDISIIGKNSYAPEYSEEQDSYVINHKQISNDWISDDMIDYTKIEQGVVYRIPSSMQAISNSLFSECENLTEIVIPSSVITIESNAFYGCPNLKKVTLSSGLTSIEDNAFSSDISLSDITIPDTVQSLGESVFHGCSSLEEIELSDSITSIMAYLFSGCSNLKKVTLSNNLKELPDEVFCDCESITEITIPDSVIRISSDAFKNCSSLTNIELPSHLTGLDNAFEGCASLKALTIPVLLDNYESYIDFLDTNDGGYTGFSSFAKCGLTDIYYKGTKLQFAKLLQIASVAPSEDDDGNRVLDDKTLDDLNEDELTARITELFGSMAIVHYESE